MSNPDTDWNPDDGPPPTEEELREAARLAGALDAAAPPAVMTPETAELLAVASRVRATAHRDDVAARDVAARAVARALQSAPPRARWLAGWSPTRVRFAAAAAVVLTAAGLGGGRYLRARAEANAARADVVFDAPVEPGAGSAPSSRLYDHGLRSYRDGLLGDAP